MPPRNASMIDGLRENERMAAELLARGKSCREVSRALGISERALYNWRKKPVVQRAIYALQQELIDVSESKGLALMPDAIATLTEIMHDENARASDRIAASRALLTAPPPTRSARCSSARSPTWNPRSTASSRSPAKPSPRTTPTVTWTC